jgi:hypothetical protein
MDEDLRKKWKALGIDPDLVDAEIVMASKAPEPYVPPVGVVHQYPVKDSMLRSSMILPCCQQRMDAIPFEDSTTKDPKEVTCAVTPETYDDLLDPVKRRELLKKNNRMPKQVEEKAVFDVMTRFVEKRRDEENPPMPDRLIKVDDLPE